MKQNKKSILLLQNFRLSLFKQKKKMSEQTIKKKEKGKKSRCKNFIFNKNYDEDDDDDDNDAYKSYNNT